MGKPIVKLMRGSRVLDLNDQSLYWLSQDFIPPGTVVTPLFASDTGDAFDQIESNGSFAFTVAIKGSSAGQINSASRAIKAMLKQAGDPRDPLYLVYKASDSVPEPLYGQFGALLRYEVAYGDVTFLDGYMVGVRRETDVNVSVSLILKPYGLGQRQRSFTATGGIIEDTFGTLDGRSRGQIVGEATTNKITNPVFGNATYTTGWTFNTVNYAYNQDKTYDLFGYGSVLVSFASAANPNFYQSLNVGNTNTHTLSCYAKIADGSDPSAYCSLIINNSGYSATAISEGDGWYRLYASAAGSNASTAYGVTVTAGREIYFTGFQLEERSYITPLAHGDMIGCAFTSTAHASTTTRTAAACKISIADDTFHFGAWTIRAVIKTPYANTHPNDWLVFDARDGSNTNAPYCYYAASVDKFTLVYSGNAVISAAQTFSAGATFVLHAVCSGTTITLYTNSASSGASIAFSPAAFGANLFIGSEYGSATQGNQTTLCLSTFNTALSAAQITNDYANIAAALANDQIVDSIPYLWTVGGDNVLALTANHQPLGVVGGVPGTAPAITEIQGAISSNWSTIKSIALNNFPCDVYLGNAFLFDMSTTAAAGDYGGEHKTSTVDTSLVLLATGTLSKRFIKYLDSTEYVIVSRLYGSAATQFTLFSYYVFNGGSFSSDGRAVTPATGYRLIRTMAQIIDTHAGEFVNNETSDVTVQLYGSKISTNVDISVDYYAMLPGAVMFLLGGDMANANFFYKGLSASQSSTASGKVTGSKPLNTSGRVIEFEPDELNHLQCYFCPDETVDPAITYTATFSTIYLTPRWSLL